MIKVRNPDWPTSEVLQYLCDSKDSTITLLYYDPPLIQDSDSVS